jgi:hypothetical protein
VSGEDDDAVVRHLIQLFDEDGARLLELVHHVAVVHHFVTDIDGAPNFSSALSTMLMARSTPAQKPRG